jgi:hypothetical protein
MRMDANNWTLTLEIDGKTVVRLSSQGKRDMEDVFCFPLASLILGAAKTTVDAHYQLWNASNKDWLEQHHLI